MGYRASVHSTTILAVEIMILERIQIPQLGQLTAVVINFIYRVGQKKPDHFLKCITLLYNDIRRRSIYQNVQLFIRSKNHILNAAVFKYSLHKVRETTLH